jgi:DNA-binding CsgD family transcriptional regulator/PAS domain-containing protein
LWTWRSFLDKPCAVVVVSEEALLAIVDRIYESIERPELWPETIYAIGEFIGGRRHFWGLDQSTPCPGVNPTPNTHTFEIGCYGTFFLSRTDLQVLDEYAQEFGELIIRFLKIVFLSILRSQNDVSAREAIGLRMAQRYLQAFEPLEGTSASSLSRAAGRRLIAALWEDGRIFSGDKLRSMRLLAPHLDRAVRLQMRLRSADLRADMVSGALDCLTHGVVLVDRSGLPLWLNQRAQEIINRSNALQLSSAGLAGYRPSDTRSLRELVKGAVSARTQGLLAISRGDDLRPLLLIAVPLKPIGSPDASDQFACGVVFISDPDRTDNPTVESLRRAFDLTYREAQTAIAIAQGHGLQAAADTMGVALTTARSQLQQAFAKTGTRHQAELAALVHRTLTLFRSSSSASRRESNNIALCRKNQF